MQDMFGFDIQSKIVETRSATVFRGKKSGEEHSVIIKVLKTNSPSRADIARFKQEYDLIKQIDLDGVIKTYAVIINDDADFVLVQEDFNGDALSVVLNDNRPLGIGLFLNMAIQLAKALGAIHKQNVIHKAIKPHTILINSQNDRIKICDFGISAVLTGENSDIYNPAVIKETLPYISPEQTGRMNRTVDYRTDLYSLGATLYEMITGSKIFTTEDPLEIIHSHIAREPVSPVRINANIPEMVSGIIMRLLAKNAEDRYQNAFGLTADLKHCLRRIEDTGKIEPFTLGRQDISNRFILPKRLYGREKELNLLIALFERMNAGHREDGRRAGAVEVAWITGGAGVGKSALINEIRKPIGARRGYFLSGKYEQFRKEYPYSAIAQAFQGLIKQLLSESDERIADNKKCVLDALGPNAQIIIDIIPEVELITGPQPNVPIIAPKEARNRFNLMFERFVGVFAKKESPILLFLDDLQWADSASLQLIANLATHPTIGYLFLVAAYRERDVPLNHLLLETLAVIDSAGCDAKHIRLMELEFSAIQQLIVDFFKCTPAEGRALAELTYAKTNGNAFFVNEFLHTLYSENLIQIDPDSGWKWDIDQIRKMQVTENVVELMAEKISRLSMTVQEVLKICACVGNRFELDTISLLLYKPMEDVLPVLNYATDEGFIHLFDGLYTFQHDRIQEAAYSLIPDSEKPFLHYQIGNLLRIKADTDNYHHGLIFSVVDHLNLGIDCIETVQERSALARMNFECGKRAKDSSAYVLALGYIDMGISLLSKTCWETDYELTLALYIEAIEVYLLIGEFDKIDQLTETAVRHARSVLDKVNIYKAKISALVAQEDIAGALSTGRQFATLIGMESTGTKSELLKRYLTFRLAFLGKNDHELLNLPDMTDPVRLAAMEFGTYMGYALYNIAPQVLVSGVFRNVIESLKYGLAPEHANNYCAVGLALISGFGDIEAGYRFGKLGMQLSERPGARKLRSLTIYVFNTQIRHWKEHIKHTIKPYLEGYRLGLESGDLLFAADNLGMHDVHCFFAGYELSGLLLTIEKNCECIKNINQMQIYSKQMIILQGVLNLLGNNDDPRQLVGSAFDERKSVSQWVETNNRLLLAAFHTMKMFIAMLFNEYEQAFEEAQNFKKYMDSVAGTIAFQQFPIMESLIICALYRKIGASERKTYLAVVKKHLKKVKKYARHAPENQLSAYYLIKAELARIQCHHKRAIKYYDLALTSSKTNDYIVPEMYISEFAANYYLEQHDQKMAMIYLINTVQCCRKWGAVAKLKQLQKLYPELMPWRAETNGNAVYSSTLSITTGDRTSQIMDLAAVLKASQIISGEVALGSLLKKMMAVAMENAGAQKAFAILQDNSGLFVEAEGSIDDSETKVLESIPVDKHPGVPAAIINYAARTKETLILNNAAEEGNYMYDPYVIRHKPKSVLCSPIVNQGRLNGLLYLENNRLSGAFTQERVTLLNTLSSQIAISLDNAKLYLNLEEKVKQRTEALDVSNKELMAAKDALWGEMALAKKIQTVLLPQQPHIANYDIAGYMKPADEVGGDYYDIINLDGRDWIVIGDVSGHGVPAGLIMMMVQTAIHSILTLHPDMSPSELLKAINSVICSNIAKMGEDKYMTLMVIACQADGRLRFSGLHQNLQIYRWKTRSIETVKTEGMWIGVTEDIAGMLNENSVDMHVGDTMLLYTDGITEANPKNCAALSDLERKKIMFGEKQLIDVFGTLAGSGSVADIKQGILYAMKDYAPADDVTFVVVKRTK